MDPNWLSNLGTNSLHCGRKFMYLLTNNNIFVCSCTCIAWLLAGLSVCFTSPEGQLKFCLVKDPLCLLLPGAFEDNLLSETWQGKLLQGWRCANARCRHTNSVSNTTDRGQSEWLSTSLPLELTFLWKCALSVWISSPFRWLSEIIISLMWWIVASVS